MDLGIKLNPKKVDSRDEMRAQTKANEQIYLWRITLMAKQSTQKVIGWCPGDINWNKYIVYVNVMIPSIK